LVIVSCQRKSLPSHVIRKGDINYDTAAFYYVYVEAIKQKLLGDNGEALKYLEECIKINPNSDASYYQLAQIVVANGDLKSGKNYLSKALSIDKENLWYLMMMADMYYHEKNLDSTTYYYEKAIKYFPDKEPLQLTLGNLYTENKKYDKAKLIFDNFDKKYGVSETSALSAIKSLMASNNYNEALIKTLSLIKEFPEKSTYNELLAEIYKEKGENEKVLEIYKKILEENPNDGQALLSLCDFFVGIKNYNELFLVLNRIVLNSGILKEDKISLFVKLIELPDIIKNKSDNLMLSLLVLEANFIEDDIVNLLRPEFLIKQGKLLEASARLEEIIKKKPENYYAWEKLLLVYLQLQDFDKLYIKGEECATNFNRSFLTKVLYANGALEKGKYDIALEELRKAEILAEDNKEFKMQVLTLRADVYYRMKEFSKSFEIFEEAVKTNSEDLIVINNYAYYLAEQNMKLKQAEKMARKVIEKDKGNNTYLDTYGWVLYKRGKLNEAARIMEQIISSGQKGDATWFEHYGFILKKQKKYTKAIENWNIAIKLDSKKVNLIKEIENCKKQK